MKKRIINALSFVVALSLLLSVFSLAACGRKMNDVEQRLVGEWVTTGGTEYTFTEDGMMQTGNVSYKFWQEGEGDHPELGHYYIIKADSHSNYAWFEDRASELYNESSFNLSMIRLNDYFRTLNETEKKLVGEYSGQDETPYADRKIELKSHGKFVEKQEKGDINGIFRQIGDGEDSLFGHYCVIEIIVPGKKSETFYYYDFSPYTLYTEHCPSFINNSGTRWLHETEKAVLGRWNSGRLFGSHIYCFNSDGTFTSFDKDKEFTEAHTQHTFYISEEGDGAFGHYIVIQCMWGTFALGKLYLYDDKPNSLYTSKTTTIPLYSREE